MVEGSLRLPALARVHQALEPRRPEPKRWVVRYRGFVLIPQDDLSWLVRPERSPMRVLPFRTPASSIADVKALVDWRLDDAQAA
ncbi:MAG: hypothetical protein WCK64_05710 [Synechococcaceae cyanobacterium ELA445]|jgi:hypothetical protein